MFLEKLMLALCLRLGIEVLVFGDFPDLAHFVQVQMRASVEAMQSIFAFANACANVWLARNMGLKMPLLERHFVEDFIFNLNHTIYSRLLYPLSQGFFSFN